MAPAQQGFAAGHLVVTKIDQRLVMDFEAAVRERLAQILLHGKPRLRACIHGRLEEAMGSAPIGLGGIHRQIGILDELIQIGAVLRSQRNAYAGIGRELVTEALIGLPNRVMNSRHKFHDIGDISNSGLNHRKLVATQTCDEISVSDAAPDAGSHGLQQLVADMMSERVVDALELVDVDIEQSELLAPAGILELAFDLVAEQHPVRQIGQRIVMREVSDLLIGTPAFGHIVDDVYYISAVAGLILNPDAL